MDSNKQIQGTASDIRDLLIRPVLRRIRLLPSANITLSTTPVSIQSAYTPTSTNSNYIRGYPESVAIKVQNMGTATKVLYGNSTSVIDTLTAVGAAVIFEAPLHTYIDLSDVWLSVDVGTTTVVEITGLYYPWNTDDLPTQPQKVK